MNIEPTKNRREDETPIYPYSRLTRSASKGRREPEIGNRRLMNEFFDGPVPLNVDVTDAKADELFEAPPICIESAQSSDREDATPIRTCTCTWEGPEPKAESRLRLGDWLVQRGLIDRQQLFVALNHADANAQRIGDAVVALGFAERDHVEEEVLALFVFSALQEI